MARTARVDFQPTVLSRRQPREDELAVCRTYVRHAAHCDRCSQPYNTWRTGDLLCPRGLAYARDIAKYIYAKGGKPHSLVDRDLGFRNEIELPVDCAVIRDLTKAFQAGLTLKYSAPVISHDPKYYVPSRRSRDFYDNEKGHGVEIQPHSSRQSRREREHYYRSDESSRQQKPRIYQDRRGSLYYSDEEIKQTRERYDYDPILIFAEPRRRSTYRV